ncbi:MAG: aldehyde:ferredoxin oxidoreductase [Acidobacteria bacterium]|nr:aldehyde:ferredoxin oxidoreductase [Acidobacteriota bacterium]
MPGGYTGKILRVNLTNKSISQIPTEKYEEFGGGHGIGSAIFFDLVGDQLPFEAFDPRNLIIMMASPFSGTFMPGSGRCEVQGLAPMLYPIEWFGHSNFGGRFTAQLKYAGWDGIVVEGAASEPVWINIVNDKVTIESANGIWGMDTWDTQEEISRRVMPQLKPGEWAELSDSYTTQVPAVVCCGPAGERKSRLGALLHGPGSQAALCGFGGVFGSKNLKAISAIGTGSVPIADPKAFMDARLWFRQFQWDVDNPREPEKFAGRGYSLISGAPSGGNVTNGSLPLIPARAAACASCPRGCRMRLASADSNEAVCAGTMVVSVRGNQKLTRQGNDMMHKLGLGHWQLMPLQGYVNNLAQRGLLGKGKQIDIDLPFDHRGTFGFWEILLRKIAYREEAGNDMAEGCARFAEKYGLLKEDLSKGVIRLTYWGTQEHYDTQTEVEWGFGSLFGERDLMLHMMANYPLHWMAQSGNPYLTAEEASKLYTDAMVPYNGDPYMIDYGDGPTGIYSDSKIKQVAWVKHYEKFWIGAGGFCGWRWPMCITNNTADRRGPTPHAEPRFWNAVTGKKGTFADYMELGHKIYTLDRAIWNLQGRHRDMEVFPDYIYDQKGRGSILPMVVDGKWTYATGAGRTLDRAKVEDFKTRFYKFEGWNPENSYPTRATLEKMGMKKVADVMQSKGKLG